MASLISVKAPEIMAWLAMMAAVVAITTPGIINHCRHQIIKCIYAQCFFYIISNCHAPAMRKQISTLSKIIKKQTGFYIYPGHADIFPAAMTKVTIQCFSTGST